MIEVPSANNDLVSYQFHLVQFIDKKLVIDDHPTACQGCHSQSLHPIWATYPLWPGAYGSDDDMLDAKAHPNEYAGWTSFFRDKAANPRYASLALGNELLKSSPDALRSKNYEELGKDVIGYDNKNLPYGLYQPGSPFLQRNNLNFTIYLAESSALLLARRVTRSSTWLNYKYAIFGALSGCSELETFLPEDRRLAHNKNLGPPPNVWIARRLSRGQTHDFLTSIDTALWPYAARSAGIGLY